MKVTISFVSGVIACLVWLFWMTKGKDYKTPHPAFEESEDLPQSTKGVYVELPSFEVKLDGPRVEGV